MLPHLKRIAALIICAYIGLLSIDFAVGYAKSCTQPFEINITGPGAKSSDLAKSKAISLAIQEAKKRCTDNQPHLRRWLRKWDLKCQKSPEGKAHYRCVAINKFRCCDQQATKAGKQPPKTRKPVSKAGKQPPKTRKPVSKVGKQPPKIRKPVQRTDGCTSKFAVSGNGSDVKQPIAQKKAREDVYLKAKAKCDQRHPKYIGKWHYKCNKNNKIYSCTARNHARCCKTAPSTPIKK
jgi:hypothetical protein